MQEKIRIVVIFIFALLLRWCITYHPHSGQRKPPMFGDYEAQRHWQEITFNLPIEKWYINSTENDLQYWGLDYPPLTAYHSLLLGHIANKIDPSYVKLHESRGLSSVDHKYFMRLTVLIADALTFLPAIIYFIKNLEILKNIKVTDRNVLRLKRDEIVLLSVLSYPGLILIDHGHFQYNCVSLGLFVGAVAAIFKDSLIVGSFLFVLALNYKQMELYHSLPFFFYILGRYKFGKSKTLLFYIYKLVCISVTVLVTFFIIWLPFLSNLNLFANVVIRLFPFSRGIFEDKVANVWCAFNVVYKLRDVFSNHQLAQMCFLTTALIVLPTCINLYLAPSKEKFVVSLINSALAFFLFSFQVHEKSILLVAVPVLLYFPSDPFACFWFLLVSHFSMLPLYMKDELLTAYFSTTIFYFIIVSWMWSDIPIFNQLLNNYELKADKTGSKVKLKYKSHSKVKRYIISKCNRQSLMILFYGSIAGMTYLSLCHSLMNPPMKYPDLFPLLISVYSAGHFFIFFLYFNYKQYATSIKMHTNKSKVY